MMSAIFLLFISGSVLTIAEEEPFALPIVGGVDSPVSDYPFLVALDGDYLCGGSIINESFILTAAHCHPIWEGPNPKVYAGLYAFSRRSDAQVQVRSVSKAFVHPQYVDNVNGPYDIAVLELNKPLTLTPGTVEKASLNSGTDCPATGDTCTVTGWGTTKYQGSISDTRRKCDVGIWARDTCKETYDNINREEDTNIQVTAGSICAGTSSGGRDACQGDSGGPLICRCNGRLSVVGVVSCGYGCGEPNIPGVYTSVAYFSSWINQQPKSVLAVRGGGGRCKCMTRLGSNAAHLRYSLSLLVLACLFVRIFY